MKASQGAKNRCQQQQHVVTAIIVSCFVVSCVPFSYFQSHEPSFIFLISSSNSERGRCASSGNSSAKRFFFFGAIKKEQRQQPEELSDAAKQLHDDAI